MDPSDFKALYRHLSQPKEASALSQVTDLGVEDEAVSAGLGELMLADLLMQLVRDLRMTFDAGQVQR